MTDDTDRTEDDAATDDEPSGDASNDETTSDREKTWAGSTETQPVVPADSEAPPPPPPPAAADTATAPTVDDQAIPPPPGAEHATETPTSGASDIPPPPGADDAALVTPGASGAGAEAVEEKPGPWARFKAAYQRSSKPLLYGSAAAVLILGILVGAAVGMTSADEERERADGLQEELDAANDEIDVARDDADKAAEDAAAEVDAAKKDAEDQVAAAQGELDDRQADLDKQAADLEKKSGDLDKRSDDLDAREGDIAGAEAAAEANSFGDGLYVVGTDIQPGTYKTEGGEFCYWERLSGLSGEFGDLITNDIGAGPKTVNIAASDAAFSSDGCGTWNKIG